MCSADDSMFSLGIWQLGSSGKANSGFVLFSFLPVAIGKGLTKHWEHRGNYADETMLGQGVFTCVQSLCMSRVCIYLSFSAAFCLYVALSLKWCERVWMKTQTRSFPIYCIEKQCVCVMEMEGPAAPQAH